MNIEVLTMRKNPRKFGDRHVYKVNEALSLLINGAKINEYEKTVTDTVFYIVELYPNIKMVTSKFDEANTNTAKDLILHLDDGTNKHVNLFLIKKDSKIQMKNPGAKSFFSKYFLSEAMQELFNQKFEEYYTEFFKNVVKITGEESNAKDNRTLKRVIQNHFPRFTDEIETLRNIFLYKLREAAFTVVKEFYNDKDEGFSHAYHTLFMTDDTTIITRYGKYGGSVSVERFSPSSPYFTAIEIYKLGKNSLGIKYGKTALTLRFKFESGPTSSIKLATSYDVFPSEAKNEAENKKTVRKMTELIDVHKYVGASNQSNAIGKCHEAITYFYFLQYYPDVSQVELNECINLLSKYYHIVEPGALRALLDSTSTIVPAIREKLYDKYSDYEIESIELVPESYIKDRLDTGDLKLILKVDQTYQMESISLKALARKSKRLTTKNPGIGTILGPMYFNVGDLTPVVQDVKDRFGEGEINHRKSLEILAQKIGRELEKAPQVNLRQGIENLLGKAMMAITFYQDNVSVCRGRVAITGSINVLVQTPTAIQTQLVWDNATESINIRVKFSKGQAYGWSTVKLTAEYGVKVD